MKTKSTSTLLIVFVLLMLLAPVSALAAPSAECIWNGDSSAAWGTLTNWTDCNGGVPTASDNVTIPSGTTNDPVISSETANAAHVTINDGASLSMIGGSLNVYGNFVAQGAFSPSAGTVAFLGTGVQTAQATGGTTYFGTETFDIVDPSTDFPGANWITPSTPATDTCDWISTGNVNSSISSSTTGDSTHDALADALACDLSGGGAPMSVEMVSTSFTPGAISMDLSFQYSYGLSSGESSTVEIISDQSGGWVPLVSYSSNFATDQQEIVSLDAYAAHTNIQIRFVFNSGGAGGFFIVDDVKVYDPSELFGDLDFYNLTVGGSSTLQSGGDLTVQNLNVNSGGVLDMGAHELTVQGATNNDGSLSQTKDVSGDNLVEFLTSGAYGGVMINADPGAAGTYDLGSTTVTIKGNQQCNVDDELVNRCFNIAPTNTSGRNASVTFYWLDSEMTGQVCGNMQAYHWTGSGWSQETRSAIDCSAATNILTVTGVSDFSPFGLDDTGPTAVEVLEFSMRPNNQTAVVALGFSLLLALALSAALLRRRYV